MSVRWHSPLSVAIVTNLVTRSVGTLNRPPKPDYQLGNECDRLDQSVRRSAPILDAPPVTVNPIVVVSDIKGNGALTLPLVAAKVDAGVPIERISRLVGHSGTSTTETIYRKQIRPVITHGADVMDQIFPGGAAPDA